MDFNLKQWRYQQQHESDLLLQQQQQPSGSPPALPLFVPELTSKLTHLSAYPPDSTTASRFPKMGSYFSLGQWQELELQALIFRHMLAGASVPPQLLHLLNKTLLNISTSPPPYHHPLQHYPHYHPTLLQTGYWGRGGMDPEPGRCRRTDGKKWRCSRDVVAGHKYCERHMNRGRNRSRKPVEIPTSSSTAAGGGGGGGGRGVGGVIKTNTTFAAQPRTAMAGGTTHFSISGPSPSIDLLHINQRPSESKTENKLCLFETQNEVSGDGQSGGGRVLRCFFDDWPTSLQQQQQQPGNAGSNSSPVISSTCLSISTPSSNHPPPPSDFSLKLSTGNADDRPSHQESSSVERERLQLNWAAAGWGTNPVAPMGGPLAEALRSSTASNSSPTSVLHQLQRGSTSETTSYVST